jgi:TrmH family RNA methyltransferase
MLSKNQIKEIQGLQLRKQRELRHLFLAEGAKTVSEILNTRPDIISGLYANADFLHKHDSIIRSHTLLAVEITEDELHKISLQSTPNQVLAVCRYFEPLTSANSNPSAFYLDDIRDPGNLGTIIRISDWFGMSTLYCSPESCEHYNPKVIQSTMGAFLRVKLTYCDLQDLRAEFPNRYGAVLEGKDVYLETLRPGLIVIGNEANGIGERSMAELTTRLTIPAGPGSGAESLNAAMAASILASEFFRQNR